MVISCRKLGLTAETAARLFLHHVFVILELPHEIISENDHLINSRFMNTVCDLADIQQHTSIVYRPQGNGRAETAVRLTVDMLRRSLAINNRPWVNALPCAL